MRGRWRFGGFDGRIAPGPVGIIDLIRVGRVGDLFGKADRIDDGLALLDRETASFDAGGSAGGPPGETMMVLGQRRM